MLRFLVDIIILIVHDWNCWYEWRRKDCCEQDRTGRCYNDLKHQKVTYLVGSHHTPQGCFSSQRGSAELSLWNESQLGLPTWEGAGVEGLPRSGGKGGIVQSVAFGGGKISMSFIVSFPNPPVSIRPEKLCLWMLRSYKDTTTSPLSSMMGPGSEVQIIWFGL